jgi:acyl-CoA reductase-like NAD-dependent aldehyde dehydrogenase
VVSSEAAFAKWSLTEPTYRRDLLLKVATILEERTQEYASYMGTEMGAEIGISAFFIMPLAIQMLKDIAGRISGICGSSPVCAAEGMSAIVYKEPYGVTLGIVPW